MTDPIDCNCSELPHHPLCYRATDPIGTAQERELIERLEALRVTLKSGDYDGADLMSAWCAMMDARDALQSRIAEVGRLTAALEDIAGAIHQGSDSDVMTWHNLANACQQKARAALSLHRRPT